MYEPLAQFTAGFMSAIVFAPVLYIVVDLVDKIWQAFKPRGDR
jgi:hypothetical protein